MGSGLLPPPCLVGGNNDSSYSVNMASLFEPFLPQRVNADFPTHPESELTNSNE